jgi:hypothetical protein
MPRQTVELLKNTKFFILPRRYQAKYRTSKKMKVLYFAVYVSGKLENLRKNESF